MNQYILMDLFFQTVFTIIVKYALFKFNAGIHKICPPNSSKVTNTKSYNYIMYPRGSALLFLQPRLFLPKKCVSTFKQFCIRSLAVTYFICCYIILFTTLSI